MTDPRRSRGSPEDAPERPDRTGGSGAVRRVTLVVLGANVTLFVAKAVVWWLTGSLAIEAEAINSLADTTYSMVVVGGIYLTTRPPDFEHPHGHERIEPFVSLFVATGIFAAAGGIIYQAGRSILAGEYVITTGSAAVGVLLFAAVTKYGLYRYCLTVGRTHNSPAVVAMALDNRNDILAAGAALAGVVGARLGYPILDPIAAGVVAIAVLYTGVEVVRDNVNYLVGRAPPAELRATIVERAIAHPEVKGVHDVVAHYVGPEIDVSLHVEVEGKHTLIEAHNIETEIMDTIRDLPAVDDVFVHVDPRELGEWKDDAKTKRITETAGRPNDPSTGETSTVSDGTREDGDPDPAADPSGSGGE